MPAYVLLSRLKPEGTNASGARNQLERVFTEFVRTALPEVKWGPSQPIRDSEYLHRFEAPNEDQAVLVSMLARIHAGAQSELWTAPEWERFQKLG